MRVVLQSAKFKCAHDTVVVILQCYSFGFGRLGMTLTFSVHNEIHMKREITDPLADHKKGQKKEE